MSTHPIPELLSLWAKNDLSAEQAIGHIIQNLLTLSQRLAALEKLHGPPPAAPSHPPAKPPALG